jgi:hypothetical protein
LPSNHEWLQGASPTIGTVPQQSGVTQGAVPTNKLMRLDVLSPDISPMVDIAPLEPFLVARGLYLPTRLVSVDASTDTGLWWVGAVSQQPGMAKGAVPAIGAMMARGLYPPLGWNTMIFCVTIPAQ